MAAQVVFVIYVRYHSVVLWKSKRVIAEEVRSDTSARELEKRAREHALNLPKGDDHRVGYQHKREQQGAVAPPRYQVDHGFLHF